MSDPVEDAMFGAGVLGGRGVADDDWHNAFDADGHWVIGGQLAPDDVPPQWPDGSPQQVQLDLHVEDVAGAHAEVLALDARLPQPADDLTAPEGYQAYADLVGHPSASAGANPTMLPCIALCAGTP